MALQKSGVTVTFNQGLDTKTDPNQLQTGKFVSLINSVFDTLMRITKRNGFGSLPTVTGSASFLTTYNGSLMSIGNNLQVLSPNISAFVPVASFTPVQVSTVSLVKNMYNQLQMDTTVAPNGLMCMTYTQQDLLPNGSFRYIICNPQTGQKIVQPTLVNSSGGYQLYSSRVFTVGNNFVIAYGVQNPNALSSVSYLQLLSIPWATPTTVGSVSIVSGSCSFATTVSFDGVVASSSLYLSWNASGNNGIQAAVLNPQLIRSNVVTIASTTANTINVTADVTGATPVIWTSAVTNGNATQSFVATDYNLNTLFSAVTVTSGSAAILQTTMSAQNGVVTAYSEISKVYGYDSQVPTNHIYKWNLTQSGTVVSSASVIARSVGLGSKAFLINSTSYFLSSYSNPFQSTYFLMNSTGSVISKHAWSNGLGYLTLGLPSVNVIGSSASFGYLIRDFITPVNKVTNFQTPSGLYTQGGINYGSVTFTNSGIVTKEIGQTLQFNGGFGALYDGSQFVENNFFLYPDSVEVFSAASGGNLTAQTYNYQAVYEWIDAQGNRYLSAPSIPVSVVATTSSSAITVNVPTPRISYKNFTNPMRLGIYRWSTGQQTYYKISPSIVMDATALASDYLTVADGVADSGIVGNEIIYTNGNVVEDVNAPASTAMTLFDDRLFMITAEDQNLLWYSKQVIENTPVETSDLFTIYVPSSTGAEGPTGVMRCLFPMDDKLIIFKKNALYYINGSGPDNTGATSQYSQPIFISSAVGCANQNSIVLIPNGLMFQSDKGIWLLGRNLSTDYIGKDVEAFNGSTVLSTVVVPNSNQVRFTLNTGQVLVYDYLVGQWGSFSGIPGLSSTIYNNLHTFVNLSGSVFQETVGLYLDGLTPTVMSFTTGWIDLSGLEGYERLYRAYMLANYKSPHTFTIGVAYDYNPAIQQTITVSPDPTNPIEQWQLNFIKQQCQAFQLTFQENYDPTVGPVAGAGLTISGLKLVIGGSATWPKNIPATQRKS